MTADPDIDRDLLEQAMALGGHRTERAAIAEALEDHVRRHRQREIIELFGTIDYGDHDYEKQRRGG